MITEGRELIRSLGSLPTDKAPAFIAGLGSNGLSFLRSLGRRGVPVVALDTWKDPGMYSRYCIPSVVPRAEGHDKSLLNFLQEAGEAVPRRGVLIPTADAFVLFVAKHRKELEKQFDFNIADYEVVLTATNKKRQYEAAQQEGVETPLTLFPEDLPIEEIAQEMSYPCILKPHYSHLWRNYLNAHQETRWGKVAEAHSRSELIDTYSEMKRSGLEFMVQERIEGGDDQLFGLLTYLDRSSKPLAVFTKRKLRQYPRGYGDGCFQVAVEEPQVAGLGLRLLQALKFRGTAGVEFKRDAQEGALKLIEVNPRSISQTYHAVVCGVDIPHIAYRDARGEPTERVTAFRSGVKWINFEKDLRAFREGRRRGEENLGQWLNSLLGERCFAFFTWDDPLPACYGLVNSAAAGLREGRLPS